ncbi:MULTISPECIES: hypothetical protein [Bacillus]|jgi:hypothetical protein|uniref:Group-specific protein n=1 Tax=Bacillus toyonensis TaxID=155322 RepID=A0A2B4VEU7_9BACI|nr:MULTISPECIES: hypothetical protein [Bacillus]KAB0447864.1 hypothetical protein CH334_12890 [Lysinibacillus sp. VIA-II-2016]KNH38104.1 hypothetical protein ACS75_23450 [Bacillus thuringiensis]KXY16772.1 hypothetical protein AT259_21830 [Bacillus cereus]MDH8707895.1 hypothetical protein [Stenotrophomonas sp. 1198]ARC28307.1 hypothetical protein A6J74_04795 [Bacillus sp. FDAARGOS_235]
MNIKFSYKGVFILLFGVICANLLLVPVLRILNLSQMHSIWLVTSIAASVLLTIVVSFIDGTFVSKVQLFIRFVLFSVGCTLFTYIIVF